MTTSKKNAFLSIVVPVYNVEPYLRECIDSIVAQTGSDYELVLVDDGSTDNSGAIADEYAKKYSNVRALHQKNSGQTAARLKGVKAATGKYVWLVDSDDSIEMGSISAIIKNLKKTEADALIFNYYFSENGAKIAMHTSMKRGVYNARELEDKIYPKMIYSGRFFYFGIPAAMWHKVMRRDIVLDNLSNVNPRIRIGEDGLTSYGALLDAESLSVMDGHFYIYRNDNVSITRSYRTDFIDSVVLLHRAMLEMNVAKRNYDLTTQINYWTTYSVWTAMVDEFIYNPNRTIEKTRKFYQSIISHKEVQDALAGVTGEGMALRHKAFLWAIRRDRINTLLLICWYTASRKHSRISSWLKNLRNLKK